MKIPRYSHEDRQKLRKRIKSLVTQGLKQQDIAKVLITEGFKTPNGGEMTTSTVSSQLFNMRKRGKIKFRISRKSREAVTAPIVEGFSEAPTRLGSKKSVIKEILSSNLSAETKVEVLAGMTNA